MNDIDLDVMDDHENYIDLLKNQLSILSHDHYCLGDKYKELIRNLYR